MHPELSKIAHAQSLQAELDADEYVQQFIIRDYGPPETYRGKQTQQKLDEIVKKCGITFAGKSFIDLGCNKGFFPLYAAATGSHRAVGVDPDPRRMKRAAAIAEFSNSNAEFIVDRFRTDISDRVGIFDIVYIGSAYHYFWLDYRKNFDQRDHDIIFDGLVRLTGEVLIFEGCTNLDDDAWRNAVLKQTGEPEQKIRAEYNDERIMAAASRHFDVTELGQSGHGSHQFLFKMRKRISLPAPSPTNLKRLVEQPLVSLKVKREADRARDVEAVSSLTDDGHTYIKKVLSKAREWCGPAITTFEKAFKPTSTYPRGLVHHYYTHDEGATIALFQEHVAKHVPLSSIPNPRPVFLRQQLAYFCMSMQRDLVTAGLIHIDIHETNVLTVDDGVKFIDFEGVIVTNSDLYRNRFSNFYALNFVAFIEALFNTGISRAKLQAIEGAEMYGKSISDVGVNNIMNLTQGPQEARDLYQAVLSQPSLLTNINLYEYLLRRLPPLVSTVE